MSVDSLHALMSFLPVTIGLVAHETRCDKKILSLIFDPSHETGYGDRCEYLAES